MEGPHETSLASRIIGLISERRMELGGKLPPERELCLHFGVNRGMLRKALDQLEADGQIWRHVGKGTFVGNRPVDQDSQMSNLIRKSNPIEVMEARLWMEPMMARLAALNANTADIQQMERCVRKARAAREWRVYETWDKNLHQAIAEATHNAVLISLYETLSTVRRAIVWGRPRKNHPVPDPSHHSHAEHAALVEAIRDRRMDEAGNRMKTHLESVKNGLLRAYGDAA